MSDVKKKLMEEINRKVARRQEMKLQAAKPKDLEHFVFNFFKMIDSIKVMQIDNNMKCGFAWNAEKVLKEQVRTIDKIEDLKVNFSDASLLELSSVTVYWSKNYQIKNDCYPETTVDVSEMLFI